MASTAGSASGAAASRARSTGPRSAAGAIGTRTRASAVVDVVPAPRAVLLAVAHRHQHPVDGTGAAEAAAAHDGALEQRAGERHRVEQAEDRRHGPAGLDDGDVVAGLGEAAGDDAARRPAADDDPAHGVQEPVVSPARWAASL